MPISVVQTKNQLITSATATHTFVFPAAVTPGNWIVIVWRQGTDNRTPNTPTAGAGSFAPTLDFTMNSSTTANRVYCWSGQHTGTATDTFQLTIQSAATAIGGFQAYELSGVDVSGTPRGGSATQSLSTGTSGNLIASPGITLNAGDIIIGALSEAKAGWGTLTAPAGFTTRLSNNSTGAVISTWVGDRTTSGTGITGAWSITSTRAVFTGYQVYREAPGGGDASISVTDTGSSSDAAPSIACSTTQSDTGTGSDATPSISCSATQTEAGSGSDGTPSIDCSLTSTDSTSGSDALGNVSCTLAQADSGAGLDSAPSCSVSLSLLESSQASDFLGTLDVLLAAITDSGSGSDFVAQIQQGILIAIAEAGLGTDAITNLACSLSTADACSGADAAAVSVQLQQILDACIGSDTVQCAASLSLIETASGVDAVACSVQLSLSDSATGVDLLTGLAAVIAIAEQCSGLETINVQTGAGASGRVATITFTARSKSAAFEPAAKSTIFNPNL